MLKLALRVSLPALLVTVGHAALGPSLKARTAKGEVEARVLILLEAGANAVPRATLGRPSSAAANAAQLQEVHEALIAAFLSEAVSKGVEIDNPDSYWLAPAIAADVRLSQIDLLESLPGVASIIEDAPLELVAPARDLSATPAADATAAALDLLGVRSLWREGLTGQGTLVASLDTGVDGQHPALKSRYRGRRADAAACWRAADTTRYPNDLKNHGTHTMGTVLGAEAADTVGIAPGAEWIAAGVVDRGRSLSQTIADILDAFQWLADPDGRPETRSDRPDVVLNSWGIPQGILPDCDATFWQVVDHLEALGTVVIFAAGNEGPGPGTLRQPADRADSYLSCFAVGAVNALDPNLAVPAFSSRGPVACHPERIKPEIVAPGVYVRSCSAGGGYKLLSGTSMAAPYVAGAVCLLRQHSPDATPQEIKEALVRSATDVHLAGPDYTTGFGLLNVRGAMAYLPAAEPVAWDVTLRQFATEEEAQPALLQGQVQFDNLGRSLKGVHVSLQPRSGGELLGPSEQYFDYVDALEGSFTIPVALSAEAAVQPGDRLWVNVSLRLDSPRLDTSLVIGLLAGHGPKSTAETVSHDGLSLVVSNTGRFDVAGAEAVSVAASEFVFDGVRIPFAGGLLFRSRTGESASFGRSDFEPVSGGTAPMPRQLSQHRFRDTRHPDPVGVEFDQRVVMGTAGAGSYLYIDYEWRRLWNDEQFTAPGSWFIWQPLSGAQLVASGPGEVCFEGDGIYFGCVWLSEHSVDLTFAAHDPAALALPAGQPAPLPNQPSWTLLREATRSDASGRFSLAFVAAHSAQEWQDAAQRARRQHAASGDAPSLPVAFELFESYPNPFNPATTIHFALEAQSDVRLEIFNALGRKVATPFAGTLPAGTHRVVWDAVGTGGERLSSGTYFVKVTAQQAVRTGKVTLLR